MKAEKKNSKVFQFRQGAKNLQPLKDGLIKKESNKKESDQEKLNHLLNFQQIKINKQSDVFEPQSGKAQTILNKYKSLFDDAPTAYYLLDYEGNIIEVNFMGLKLLGKDNTYIINNNFKNFLKENSLPVFELFLKEAFEKKIKVFCEVELEAYNKPSPLVYIDGLGTDNSKTCQIAVIDISERKKLREKIQYINQSEEKIRNAAQMWQITFDAIPDMVSIQDKDFRLINVNKAYEKKFNIKFEDLRGKKCFEIVHHTNCEIKNCPHRKTLTTKQITREEVFEPLLGAYLEIMTSPLFDDQGELLGTVHVAKDITVRKNIQQALRKSERKYRSLVETAPDALIVHRNNKIVYLNSAARKLFGASKDEEILGKSPSEVVTPGYYSTLNERIEAVLKGSEVPINEIKILRLDGNLRDCEISASRYEDAEGTAVQVILHDITERKVIEKKLLESEERFRILTEAMPQIVWSADKAGAVDFYNKHTYEYAGVKKGDIEGWNWLAAIHPKDKDETVEKWKEAIKAGKLYRVEHRIRRKDGEYRWHLTRGVPVVDSSGLISRWIGTSADIHEQKTIEEILEKRVAHQTQEIRKANAYNRNLLEVSLDPLVTIGPDGKITDVNKAVEKVTGIERNNLIGTDFSSYFTKPEKAKAGYLKVFSEGKIKDYSLTVKHISGKTTDVLYNASTFKNEDGEIQGVFAAARDITARKKAEENIRIQADRLYTVISTIQDGFLVFDASGYILDVNEIYLNMTGYSREEILKFSLHDIEAQESVDEINLHMKKVFQSGYDRFESKHKRKDGSTFDVEISVSYRKMLNQFLLFVRDITQRKYNEMIIETERKRFSDVLEMLPAYVVLLTTDHHVRHSNRYFKELFGKGYGKHCYEFIFGLNKPCETCVIQKVLSNKRYLQREWTGPDNRSYYIYDFPFTDSDGNELVLELGIDITKQKQAEHAVRKLNEELEKRVQQRTAELLLANQELEAFSYSVSHDLRTPLSSIDGFAKIIHRDLSSSFDDEYKDYLKRIIDSSEKMSNLITGLLNLSRISRTELNLTEVRLDIIANEIINRLIKSDQSRKINYIIQPDIIINADLNLFSIVMENLINNAWKFTRYTGEAEIQIGTTNIDGESVYFVRDNGEGFDMKYAGKLFNPFQRLHDSKKFEGNGIGLATIKRIIDKHQGKIWVESEINKGTIFYFTISK